MNVICEDLQGTKPNKKLFNTFKISQPLKLFRLTFHYHFQFFQTFEYYNYFDLAKIRISRARAAKTQFAFTLATFIRQNFKKKFLEPIQSYEDVLFLGPKCSTCPLVLKKNFLVQTITRLLSSTYKHFLKQPICPNENFFHKIC